MKKTIRYYAGAWTALASGSAAAAETASLRHEIEMFFSSGVGTVVSIILFLLLLAWLLLPLAVFGLKTRLREITRQTRQANSVLAELQATGKALTERTDPATLLAEIRETNRLLAEIRDEFAAISSEATEDAQTSLPGDSAQPEDTADLYKEIKFDP